MFTIKNVSPAGSEELFTGTSPSYFSGRSDSGLTGGAPFFTYADLNSQVQTITSGKVYVMNDSGRTVASYDLPSVDYSNQLSGQFGSQLNGNYQSKVG